MSHNTEVNVSIINGFDQYDKLYQWSKNRVTKIKVEIIGVYIGMSKSLCVYILPISPTFFISRKYDKPIPHKPQYFYQ